MNQVSGGMRRGRAGWDKLPAGEVRCQEALIPQGPQNSGPLNRFPGRSTVSQGFKSGHMARFTGLLISALHPLHAPPAQTRDF